jgi:hypothetical protein
LLLVSTQLAVLLFICCSFVAQTLKRLRHPNIVKYFYSEEPQALSTHTNTKLLLITEGVRPLVGVGAVLDELSKEQIISGLYGITNAVLFLHERVN